MTVDGLHSRGEVEVEVGVGVNKHLQAELTRVGLFKHAVGNVGWAVFAVAVAAM